MKAGRLNELSFAFDVMKSAWIEDEDDPKAVRELQEVKLYECSAVPIGANSETGVLAIKSGTEAVLTSALLEAKPDGPCPRRTRRVYGPPWPR